MRLPKVNAPVVSSIGRCHVDQRAQSASTALLSEAAWASAPKIGDLIQRQPDTGQPPTERTDVTLLRDEDNLYIGVHAYDAEPDRVVGTQMMRDGALNVRRSHRDRARHVSRSAKRVLLRDQPRGRARRRPRVRQRAVEHRLGRHLACPHDAHEHRVDGGVCHSVQEPQLSGRRQRVGIQHRSHDFPQARGRPLVGRAARHAVSSGVRSRARSRTSPGSRRASGSIFVRSSPDAGCIWRDGTTTTSQQARASTCSTASRPVSG